MDERKAKARRTATFLLPLALLILAFFVDGIPNGTRAAILIALPWFFLIERKGYPVVGNLALLLAGLLWILIPDTTEAFFLAALPLLLPAILLPGRRKSGEIWVLSAGGPGAFEFGFRKDR